MKTGGGAVLGIPRAAAFPAVLFSRRRRPSIRCYSSFSGISNVLRSVRV